MTTAIVRLRRGREHFERLMSMSDHQLSIMETNAAGAMEEDMLFRILRSKGDAANMAKFFNRSLTEREYKTLIETHYKEYMAEKGKEFLALKEAEDAKGGGGPVPKKPDAAAEGAPAPKTKAITSWRDAKSKALAKVFGDLGRRGWTTDEITTALTTCKEMGFKDRKLRALAKFGVEPENVRDFLKAHEELSTIGWAAANSHHLFSFEILVEIFQMVEKDPERFVDFVEFCNERPTMAEGIQEYMQLGKRGRIADLRIALKRMMEIYDATYGSSGDIRDIDYLNEVGPETDDTWPSEPLAKIQQKQAEIDDVREMLHYYEIACVDDEERLAPDAGNFLEIKRRRRGGF